MTQPIESSSFERKLIGQRVAIRSLDWKQQITGKLIAVERYQYILELDKGGTLGLHKHSCGGIGIAPPLEEKT